MLKALRNENRRSDGFLFSPHFTSGEFLKAFSPPSFSCARAPMIFNIVHQWAVSKKAGQHVPRKTIPFLDSFAAMKMGMTKWRDVNCFSRFGFRLACFLCGRDECKIDRMRSTKSIINFYPFYVLGPCTSLLSFWHFLHRFYATKDSSGTFFCFKWCAKIQMHKFTEVIFWEIKIARKQCYI